jgi:hypothetical protein
MQIGDWIEHLDAPATRGIVVAGEVGGDLHVLVSGIVDPVIIKHQELLRWWEPLHADDGAIPPFWVKERMVFLPRMNAVPVGSNLAGYVFPLKPENIARIYAFRPGWVAFHDCARGAISRKDWEATTMGCMAAPAQPVFMIQRWTSFYKMWTPEIPPTAWTRLLYADEL